MAAPLPVTVTLLLAGLLTSFTNTASESISEQALTKKLDLAKKMVTQIHHQTQANRISTGAWVAPYQQSVDKINQIQLALYQGENTKANKIITELFALIRATKGKLNQQLPDVITLTAYFERRNIALGSFKSSLQQTLKERKDAQGNTALATADALQQRAGRIISQDIHQAITVLEQAYELVVSQITRLRNNETIVVSLNFETPKDEYLYDLKRVKSFKLLLEMQLNKKPANTGTLKLITSLTDKANKLAQQAHHLATQNKYQEALSVIAQSIKNQQRALRSAGLNIM